MTTSSGSALSSPADGSAVTSLGEGGVTADPVETARRVAEKSRPCMTSAVFRYPQGDNVSDETTELNLDDVRRRLRDRWGRLSYVDIRNLVAEVERLRALMGEERSGTPGKNRSDRAGRVGRGPSNVAPVTEPITDGFGSEWVRCWRDVDCGIQVVRPGKAQCWCDDGSTEPPNDDYDCMHGFTLNECPTDGCNHSIAPSNSSTFSLPGTHEAGE